MEIIMETQRPDKEQEHINTANTDDINKRESPMSNARDIAKAKARLKIELLKEYRELCAQHDYL